LGWHFGDINVTVTLNLDHTTAKIDVLCGPDAMAICVVSKRTDQHKFFCQQKHRKVIRWWRKDKTQHKNTWFVGGEKRFLACFVFESFMKLLRKNRRNRKKRKKESWDSCRWWVMWEKFWCWISTIEVCSLLYLMVNINFFMVGNNFPFPY